MGLKTLVLVSGINNLSDARYCAGMGVDLMGFKSNPDDPDYINPETSKDIAGWISGVAFVGEFGEADPEVIQIAVNEFHFDFIEVSNPKTLIHLKHLGIPLILSININALNELSELGKLLSENEKLVEYFILNASGIVEENSWRIITGYLKHYPILLGFNLRPATVNEMVDNFQIKGISLKGGYEIKPGYKDFDELAEILEALEIDDYS